MAYDVTCSSTRRDEGNQRACRPQPPFWWLGRNIDHEPRDPDSEDYYNLSTFNEVQKKGVLTEMKLGRKEEYTPGEIHLSQKPDLRFGTSSQAVQWTPKSPDFHKLFDINSVPLAENYLYNMVKKRQQLDLASTLKEDSDYSVKDGSELAGRLRPVQVEAPQVPLLSSSDQQPRNMQHSEHFFCECHQYHSIEQNNSLSKTIVCNKCGCKYVEVDQSKLDASRRIMAATNAHIAGTNPNCFRDVIGRN